MTDTTLFLKTDCLGRVTVGREQREALLDAFEASSMSGLAFARRHGLVYQTFASWIQKRRRTRGDDELTQTTSEPSEPKPPVAKKLALTFAEVTLPSSYKKEISPTSTTAAHLKLTLPCGASIEVSDRLQIPILLEILTALPIPPSPC